MIVIIEGEDRCGKSTLVEQLRKNYFTDPKTIVHHSSSPPNVKNRNSWEICHYSNMLHAAYSLQYGHGFDVIFDRFHLGAIVYGKKYRNANPEDIYAIESLYVRPTDDIALVLLTDWSTSIIERNDDNSFESTIEEFDQTREAFEEAFRRSVIPHKLHINITENGGFRNTYEAVTKFLDGVCNAKSG